MAGDGAGGWASTVVVGSITGIALSADWLPERVASHFGASGVANGFMARDLYVALLIGLAILAPALVGLLMAHLARRYPALLQLPNRDYWLSGERRDETSRYLTEHAGWLVAAVAAFALGFHLLVIRANHLAPQRLELGPLIALLIAFGACLAAWVGGLQRRFERRLKPR